MDAEELLSSSRSIVGELIGKAWELGGYTVGEREFGCYDYVQNGRWLIAQVDKYFTKKAVEKEQDHNNLLAWLDIIREEKRHWEEADKPKRHHYHLFITAFKQAKLEYERKYKTKFQAPNPV